MRPDFTDVAALIHRGFLTGAGWISGVRVVWKTLTAAEIDRILLYGRGDDADAAYLALSTLLFGDEDILSTRSTSLPALLSFYRDLPIIARELIGERLNALGERTRKASDGTLIEAYSYTDASRVSFRALHGRAANDPLATGWATGGLGMTTPQVVWTGLMSIRLGAEDRRIHWEGAKLVAATMAPKVVRSIEAREDARDRLDRQRQRALVLGERLTEDGHVLNRVDSVEEMRDEMERALKGIKDDHDRAIERYEVGVTGSLEAVQRQVTVSTSLQIPGRRLPDGTLVATAADVRAFREAERRAASQRAVAALDAMDEEEGGGDLVGVGAHLSREGRVPASSVLASLAARQARA